MTELERKALMGDKEAQEECTRQGIVLNCPRCGKTGAKTQYVTGDFWYECPHCGCVFQAKKGEYCVGASPISWRSYAQIDCLDCGNKLEKIMPLPLYTCKKG